MTDPLPNEFPLDARVLPLPNWRWEWVTRVTEEPPTRYEPAPDRATGAAQGFWQAWKRCCSDAERSFLSAKRPGLATAVLLAEGVHGRLGHVVEARVLAGEPPNVIAAKAGLGVDAVRWYEHLFFDVRRFLDRPDYILHRVVGVPDGAMSETSVWKIFGYLAGPVGLDLLMGAPARPCPPGRLEAANYLAATARDAIHARAALAARAFAAGHSGRASELVRVVLRSAGIGDAEQRGTREAQLERHVKAMFEEIHWSVGREGEEAVGPVVAQFDRLAAELRDDELQKLAAGGKPPDLDSIEELRLPPPRAKKSSPSRDKLL